MYIRLSTALVERLCCPACRERLAQENHALRCTGCDRRYPVTDGVPALLHDPHGILGVDHGGDAGGPAEAMRSHSPLRRLRGLAPDASVNLTAVATLTELANALRVRGPSGKVLVVGCGERGAGMQAFERLGGCEIVHSDVIRTAAVDVLLDAHAVPFLDDTFDAVIAQAVLEHVPEPERCVGEIWRVLKPAGLVYAETPFMQQVHGGAYDFTRFTAIGHRRLFRRFQEVRSAVVAGPGTALGWSWEHFLMSFASRGPARGLLRTLGRATGFWLKYFDYHLAAMPGAWGAASAYSFLGRKGPPGWELADAELIAAFSGSRLPRPTL